MNKPPLEEATKDLNNIRAELEAMRVIKQQSEWLSHRDDVDSAYFAGVAMKVSANIIRGVGVEQKILNLYPELP